MSMIDRAMMQASAGRRLALIAESYARLAGEPLIVEGQELWDAPFVVVAHDTETPPLFFYGNKAALDLFKLPARKFIGMESSKSAEPALREERAAMLARLDSENIIRDYRGIRIASDGTRFMIANATVWNLIAEDGRRHGQAATFAEWSAVH